MQTLEDVQTWRGKHMVDPDGDKIGTIEDIFLDRQTGEPAWAAVKTGLFGRKHTLVPIRDAVTQDDEIRVSFDKEQVKDAPNIDPDGELLARTRNASSGSTTAALTTTSGRATIVRGRWRCPTRTRTGRAGRTTEAGPTAGPAIVGVRLRRVVVLSVPATSGARPRDTAPG